jgi:ribonuclease Z
MSAVKRSSYPHETEFSVITVGTGNPEPSLQRASACTVIQYRDRYYAVDMGNGAQNGLLKGGNGAFSLSNVAALCFTHFHQDHTNDYFDIITNRWLTGGGEVMVVGPPDARALHDFLVTFFKDDLAYRWMRQLSRGVTGSGMFTDVIIVELTGSNRLRVGDLDVTTAELTHTMYDLGYRFEGSGSSVVISGDTAYDDRLVELAQGADMLVMDGDERCVGDPGFEMPSADALEVQYRPSGRFRGNFAVRPHARLDDIAVMVAAAGVKHLVLTHLRPGAIDEGSILEVLASRGFAGRVTFASDGLEIPVHVSTWGELEGSIE